MKSSSNLVGSEFNRFWASLAKFWPSNGHNMTENVDFRPLFEKVSLCGIIIILDLFQTWCSQCLEGLHK